MLGTGQAFPQTRGQVVHQPHSTLPACKAETPKALLMDGKQKAG